MPKRARCRAFTVADMMIFIVATSLTLAYLEAVRRDIPGQFFLTAGLPILGLIRTRMNFGFWCGAIFALPATYAWLIVRLRRPRPRRRHLARQPGMSGCLAAAVPITWRLAFITPDYFVGDRILGIMDVVAVSFGCGEAALAVWIVLGWGGLFRREPGWIDASGLAIAGFWVAMMLTHLFEFVAFYLL